MKRSNSISRRRFIKIMGASGAALSTGGLLGIARAQSAPETFLIASHKVHQDVATIGTGGNIVADWASQSGVQDVIWQTASTEDVHELLFREASLRETRLDVGYILNSHLFPRVTNLFEPLDAYMDTDPIENIGDFFPGMIDALTMGGSLYGVPVRHVTDGLHYNQQYFDERGIAGPPETIEEFADFARRLTYDRSDGTRVHGLVMSGVKMYSSAVSIARAWNADFISADFEIKCNEPPMVKAVSLLAELFEEGVLPTAVVTLDTPDMERWMMSGRAAMAVTGTGRHQLFNNAEQSQVAGNIQTSYVPISETVGGEYEAAPVKIEFWSMAIPAPSQHKELSWDFIKHLSSPESVLAMALNGNGPTRESTYQEPAFNSVLPYADVERRALREARIPLPAFDRSAHAADLITEEVQSAVLGRKDAQQAMDDLARRLEPLLRDA